MTSKYELDALEPRKTGCEMLYLHPARLDVVRDGG